MTPRKSSSPNLDLEHQQFREKACAPIIGTVASGVRTDDIGQRDGTNTDYSMQIVPESFSPLDNRQSLGYHWYIWFVATFLVFQSFPLLREILHDWHPLKVSSSGSTANGIIEPKKLGRHNQFFVGTWTQKQRVVLKSWHLQPLQG